MTSEAPTSGYVGRFAPSPTGALHFGSLLAATASYLDARSQGGQWLVRIEDIDPPRLMPGADTAILEALEAYGFEWDGEVCYQSRRIDRHRDILRQLTEAGHTYPCGCSRQDLSTCRRGPLGIVYPGYCRRGCSASDTAVRVRTDDTPIEFTDQLQGRQVQRLESESGDFVVLRRDGLIAYHLAVVADDFDQGVTHVVRGIDLLDSTPRQIHLQRLLHYPRPQYAHIPVAEHPDGRKLAKSTGARAVATDHVRPTLLAALDVLGQQPETGLRASSLESIWSWATNNWRLGALANRRGVGVPVHATGGSSADPMAKG